MSSAASSSSTPSSDSSESIIYEIPIVVIILALYIVLGHGLEIWKDHQLSLAEERKENEPTEATSNKPRPMLCTFHESGAAILLGLAVGLLMNYRQVDTYDFDAQIFFYVVLPPIIFHQGYAFKKRNFFKFFHYIFGFGIFGTMVQFIILTILCYYLSNMSGVNLVTDDGVVEGFNLKQAMILSSIFCAADEVATVSLIQPSEFPKLSAILFGEGVMNDALSILLFHAVTSTGSSSSDLSGFGMIPLMFQVLYLCITAAGVGLGSALLVSLLLKSIPSLQSNSVRQTAILMLGGYFSFSVSEALSLSGVLTVFFCGLTLSHYAWHSLGTEAQVASKITSDTISMIAEAYCFAAIGLSVHQFNLDQWSFSFVFGMMGVLMIARFIGIYGICLLGYLVSPKNFKMPLPEQNVLFFGGLVRGSISWAQVMQVDDSHRITMITTVLGLVVTTVIVFGIVMPFFTRHLQPEKDDKAKNKALDDSEANRKGDGSRQRLLEPEAHLGLVHRVWARVDDNFMKPIFGGSQKRHGSIVADPVGMDNSRGTMRVKGPNQPRARTYSGIARLLPQSYGAVEPDES